MKYSEFHKYLFPSDPVPNPRPRLEDIPDDADFDERDILKHISECTGVSEDYLENAVASVMNGLAGLQCLWFLDGASGLVSEEGRESAPAPDWVAPIIEEWISKKNSSDARYRYELAGGTYDVTKSINWARGLLYLNRHPKPGSRIDAEEAKKKKFEDKVKLGKIFTEMDSLSEKRHRQDFDGRSTKEGTVVWHWVISTHPFDVLTMSFRRAWRSCMRPPGTRRSERAGEASLGPLTDMAAGSAVIFFFGTLYDSKGNLRPLSEDAEPCARLLLRPGLSASYVPVILHGGRVYPGNNGPLLTSVPNPTMHSMLIEATGLDFFVTSDSVCTLGNKGLALSRNVYSDTGGGFCTQSSEDYKDAYERLGKAWNQLNLVAKLSLGKLRSAASDIRRKKGYGIEDDAKPEVDIDECRRMGRNEVGSYSNLADAMRALMYEYQNGIEYSDEFSMLVRDREIADLEDATQAYSEGYQEAMYEAFDRAFENEDAIIEAYVYGKLKFAPVRDSGIQVSIADIAASKWSEALPPLLECLSHAPHDEISRAASHVLYVMQEDYDPRQMEFTFNHNIVKLALEDLDSYVELYLVGRSTRVLADDPKTGWRHRQAFGYTKREVKNLLCVVDEPLIPLSEFNAQRAEAMSRFLDTRDVYGEDKEELAE